MNNGRRTIQSCLESKSRTESGAYLLELLVAVLASGILAASLANHMGETMKLTTSGQNQLFAAAITQELVDITRNTNYTTVKNLRGQTLSFNVNGDNPGNPLTTRPLMMDLDSNTFGWSDAAEKNRFAEELHDSSPTVQETISDAGWGVDASGDPAGIKIDILIRWDEQNMTRSYSMTTYISRQGIHNY